MTELAAIIFDVDGTLADTERDGHRVAFNQAFVEAGLDWDWTVPLYGELLTITGGKERILHYLDCHNMAFKRPALLDVFIRQLHKAKTRHYTRMLAQGAIPLRSGVRRLLEEARRAGVRLAIATTTTPANVVALLEHVEPALPESWFEVIAAGDIVAAKKPAPDIYEYVLQRMSLDAAQCIALEDSENGLESACRAGLCTVITVNAYTREQDFSSAALVIDNLGEPDRPFTLLNAVDTAGHRHVDMAMLRHIHSCAQP